MASAMAAVHPQASLNPMSSAAGDTGTSGAEASTISANDFLTLLVTEMKNQDPTAQTDPNEYISQLVQVNSLEQLIQINQNLSTAEGGTNTGGSTPAPKTVRESRMPEAVAPSAVQSSAARPSGQHSAALAAAAHSIPSFDGNLGVPQATSAARRVAQALNGR